MAHGFNTGGRQVGTPNRNRTARKCWRPITLITIRRLWTCNHERSNMALGGITSKQKLTMVARPLLLQQVKNGGGITGDSQGLVGQFGKGKIAAFGYSHGFLAMVFDNDEGKKNKVGMNHLFFDWKNFVLKTFDWLRLPDKPIKSNQVTSTLQPTTP